MALTTDTHPCLHVLPDIREALLVNRPTILCAPPGSGKTTAIPQALIDDSWLAGKKIIMLEPRRIAARRAATYIAQTRNEPVGKTIGYHIRLERKVSAHTRLEILTEGILSRRLISDPELDDVGLIIFDEFHERSLAADTALAFALEIQRELRPELRIMIMSATLQTTELLAHLGPDTQVISSPSRTYPVDIHYLPTLSPVTAISQAIKQESGSILVFLPGEGEINRCMRDLKATELPGTVDICPLYANLPKGDQDRAIAPPTAGQRKIVLATSIAESSVTIEGIRVVIDVGQAKVPIYNLNRDISRLELRRISQDRATQRTGRAGRTQPGVCYRLWSAAAQATLPEAVTPEILTTDLTPLALLCAEWGSDVLPWLTPPPPTTWSQANQNLIALGALDDTLRLTPLGKRMVQLPLHPAIASLLLHCHTCDPTGVCLLAAILQDPDADTAWRGLADFRKRLAIALHKPPYIITQQARRFADLLRIPFTTPRLTADELAPLAIHAYPNRICKCRQHQGSTYLCAAGFGASLPPDDPMTGEPWLLAIDLTERDAQVIIRCALPLSPSTIEQIPTILRTKRVWDKKTDSLKRVQQHCIGQIPIKESPLTTPITDLDRDLIMRRIAETGLQWSTHARAIAQRLHWANTLCPEDGWPDVLASVDWIRPFIDSIKRGSDIQSLNLIAIIDQALALDGLSRFALDQLLPETYRVPSGAKIKIRYDGDQPYIAVRIQEVFGLQASPTLGKGRLKLSFHLLSPAQRPIQITQDLAGFWQTSYHLIRKEMRGRYPKHRWPEEPTAPLSSQI